MSEIFKNWKCKNCGKDNNKYNESCFWCTSMHPIKRQLLEKDKEIEKLKDEKIENDK